MVGCGVISLPREANATVGLDLPHPDHSRNAVGLHSQVSSAPCSIRPLLFMYQNRRERRGEWVLANPYSTTRPQVRLAAVAVVALARSEARKAAISATSASVVRRRSIVLCSIAL